MIGRRYGLITVSCDSCEETVQSTEAFKEAWARAKREGWFTQKIDDDLWTHTCPGCAELARE